jgi:signal transduction histidine kinase
MRPERLRLRDVARISSFRLSVSMGAVFLLGVLVLLAAIYALTTRELTTRSDHILRDEARRLLAVPPAALPDRLAAEMRRNLHGLNFFALISGDGETMIGNIDAPAGIAIDRPIDSPARPGQHGPLRILAVRTPQGERLLIGRDISQIADLRHELLIILLASGGVIVLGMSAAGIALSVRPLRRVRALQGAAGEIAAGQLEVRMPIAGARDELDQFAGTVNAMVEEVGRVVAQVKGVTDAIAHDLRSPLARVRAHLDRTAELPALPEEAARHIAQASTDIDLVLGRFAALLRISELEASGRRKGFGPVDLAGLARNVAELYEPLAEERGVALVAATGAPVMVEGDEQLLFEAVSNLADNAVKFTPPGGRIMIAVRADGAAPILEVRDDGPGIAAAERAAVLRRFHRGAGAETVPGSGLGLSVVAAIIHLHGFAMELDDAKPGLIVRIRIPG